MELVQSKTRLSCVRTTLVRDVDRVKPVRRAQFLRSSRSPGTRQRDGVAVTLNDQLRSLELGLRQRFAVAFSMVQLPDSIQRIAVTCHAVFLPTAPSSELTATQTPIANPMANLPNKSAE